MTWKTALPPAVFVLGALALVAWQSQAPRREFEARRAAWHAAGCDHFVGQVLIPTDAQYAAFEACADESRILGTMARQLRDGGPR